MHIFDRTTVSEFLGDRVVYRNLVPMDDRLPALADFRAEIGLPAGRIPRKSEPDYARAIVHLLRRARALDAPRTPLRRLLFIGDTRMNDGTAFANLCRAGEWPGLAFIADETNAPPAVEVVSAGAEQSLYLANRWAALADFDRFCAERGFPVDEATAVIVDLDKTALGARGRNAHVIDRVRVQAVHQTVAGLLGDAFDEAAFQTAYAELNQSPYHPFTGDNQDYLAYICLILGSGLFDLQTVIADVQAGRLTSFRQFIEEVEAQSAALRGGLADIHADIFARVQQGDPTPFKMFRRNEYLATVSRMGQMDDSASAGELLAEEIVITQEVRALALAWGRRGALLFGLSDKPDEASVPSPEQAAQGYRPIHRTPTHAVGEVRH